MDRSSKSGGSTRLSGTIPALDQQSHLASVSFADNALAGTIPHSFLKAAEHVKTVDLSGNTAISGTVPAGFTSHPNTAIDLSDTYIVNASQVFCNVHQTNHSKVATCSPCQPDRSTCAQTSVNEREILEAFYRSAKGDLWTRRDFWLTSADHCQWFGVGCMDGRVALLNLQDNNLEGALNDRLWELPYLQVVWLGFNTIHVVFDGIHKAKRLMDLRLPSVGIPTLTGLGKATSLGVLHLQSNRLEGTFPTSELSQLSNLRIIELNNNQFSGPLHDVPFAKHWPYLRVLDVSENAFTGNVPSFEDSVALTELRMAKNQLQGVLPPPLLASVQERKRVHLDVSSNQLDGTIPKELRRFSELDIDVTNNALTDIPPALCQQVNWNDGAVAISGCDAILCPAGTWNRWGKAQLEIDRATTASDAPRTTVACQPCGDDDKVMGKTLCANPIGSIEAPRSGSRRISYIQKVLWCLAFTTAYWV